MVKKNLIVGLLFLASKTTFAQSTPIIDTLFRNSFKVFELQRLPNGMYRDAKLFSGADYHPISVSNTGMGLIALCIADSMEWITDAEVQVLATLNAVNGNYPGFSPDRTSNGYFRHFLDVNTGEQMWNSEYSTIDTDILTCGALFAKKYFNNPDINAQVAILINSIDFGAAIANPADGSVFLTMDATGNGINGSITLPYNEYMIVAWLAKNLGTSSNIEPQTLWNNFYETPQNLPVATYNGNQVLTDNPSSFLSGFTHQFNYYLCHHFTISNVYINNLTNSMNADKEWWQLNNTTVFPWGMGAGSAITSSYHADAINNNPDFIASPHIIAGYIPVSGNCKNDLIDLWNSNSGKYRLPTASNDSILWRFSTTNPLWQPNEIIGVDHSVMLFGLATLPEYLGSDFFAVNNDFFGDTLLGTPTFTPSETDILYPNPAKNEFSILVEKPFSTADITLTSMNGSIVAKYHFSNQSTLKITSELQPGIYFVEVKTDNYTRLYKLFIE